MVHTLISLSLLLLTPDLWASYRVYQLKVIHYDNFGKIKKTRKVMSTLDPLQYEHIEGGYRWDRVELLDTWYCPGDTSGKKLCKKPKVIVRGPAAYNRDKRNELPYTRQPVIP